MLLTPRPPRTPTPRASFSLTRVVYLTFDAFFLLFTYVFDLNYSKAADFFTFYDYTFRNKVQRLNFLQQFSPVTLDSLLLFFFFISTACEMQKVLRK